MFDLDIREEGEKMIIGPPPLQKVLSLFSYDKQIIIDPEVRVLSIILKMFYFYNSRTDLSFDDLWYIDYEYEQVQGKNTRTDYYITSVVTRNERKHKLFTVQGAHESHVGLGVQMVDGSDDESRGLVVQVSGLLGIPIGKPLDEDLNKVECEGCGRTITAISSKCLYCGAVRYEE